MRPWPHPFVFAHSWSLVLLWFLAGKPPNLYQGKKSPFLFLGNKSTFLFLNTQEIRRKSLTVETAASTCFWFLALSGPAMFHLTLAFASPSWLLVLGILIFTSFLAFMLHPTRPSPSPWFLPNYRPTLFLTAHSQ